MATSLGSYYKKNDANVVVADGGTNADDAATARTNLGVDLTLSSHNSLNHQTAGVPGLGKIVQQIRARTTSSIATAGGIDPNLRPTTSQGTFVLQASITPQSATNILLFEFRGSGAGPGGTFLLPFLFQTSGTGSSVNAIACAFCGESAGAYNNMDCCFVLTHYEQVNIRGWTSGSMTFRCHVGNSGTVNTPNFGGFASTTFIITEISP